MNKKNIFLVLNLYYESPVNNVKAYDKVNSIGQNDFQEINQFIIDREYVVNIDCELHIQEIGKLYLIELKKELEQEEQDKIAERQKLRNEAIISERTIKTFWAVFIFGLFGGIYSAYDLFNKITSNKEVPKEQVTKQEMEEELSKLRTLFLTQKRVDSLRIPNSELNK